MKHHFTGNILREAIELNGTYQLTSVQGQMVDGSILCWLQFTSGTIGAVNTPNPHPYTAKFDGRHVYVKRLTAGRVADWVRL